MLSFHEACYSYKKKLAPRKGIEPLSAVLETVILPLNYRDIGAVKRIRTPDTFSYAAFPERCLNPLSHHCMYFLSMHNKRYIIFLWCLPSESNWRPMPYHGIALPTELSRHFRKEYSLNASSLYVDWLFWRINFSWAKWRDRQDLNLWPSD